MIFIEKKKKLIFDSFSDTEECIICEKIKKTCCQICKSCLIKSATVNLCMEYFKHQTKLAKKHYRYNYENELSELYFKKYHKKFNPNKKEAQSFLKKYCLSDEISFAKYIRNTRKGGK